MQVQVVSDNNDNEWTFVIKSWPNGGENKRVYVMEKTGMLLHDNACCACIAPAGLHSCCAWPLHALQERMGVLLTCVSRYAAGYMRRNKMTIGDVIAITRRPDGQLVCLKR